MEMVRGPREPFTPGARILFASPCFLCPCVSRRLPVGCEVQMAGAAPAGGGPWKAGDRTVPAVPPSRPRAPDRRQLGPTSRSQGSRLYLGLGWGGLPRGSSWSLAGAAGGGGRGGLCRRPCHSWLALLPHVSRLHVGPRGEQSEARANSRCLAGSPAVFQDPPRLGTPPAARAPCGLAPISVVGQV